MLIASLRRTIFVFVLLGCAPAFADWLDPLPTYNQSPLVQIFGLPAPGPARVLAPGRWRTRVSVDLANNFLFNQAGTESITLDGETHRTTLAVKRGTASAEWGIEIPYVSLSGGFLDSFIGNWHDVFGLPQGGRDGAPPDQLNFLYERDGVTRLRITQASRGIGDVRLTAGWQLPSANDMALRASLKLPTGDATELHGSGAPDFALWLATACASTACRTVGWTGSGGAVLLGSGDVLPAQQRRLVAFGGAGLAYRPWQPIVFKVDLRVHSPFYRDTSLRPLGVTAFQVILGGTWIVDESTAIDIGVTEDVRADTAPDVSLLISLRANF
jgi:Protein of unknown function (DUF3187)